jgi:hypothetical protein
VAVVQGSPATFTVGATGSTPLGYQWQFGGGIISGATQSSYTDTNCQPADAGNYTVVVSNIVGTVTSSNAVLTVNLPPTINVQPQNRTINQGGNTFILVSATGTGTMSYQWMQEGTNIAGATGTSYAFTNIQPSQAGNYSAYATNLYGSATSQIAVVTVRVPPSITTQPTDQTVPVGSNATFQVVAAGTAPLGYQWYFNSSPLGGATLSSYTITGAQTNNAGVYSVVISNVVNTLTSSNAQLTVTVPLPQPPQLQLLGFLPDGRLQLLIVADPGSSNAVDGAPDLTSWIELGRFLNTNGSAVFIDDSATNNPLQFYRARVLLP